MKQFLNVLYRRILYKIPLKFLLILLALFAVCFASFSDATIIKPNEINPDNFEFTIVSNFRWSVNLKSTYSIPNWWILCTFVWNANSCTLNDWNTTQNMGQFEVFCMNTDTAIINCTSSSSYHLLYYSDDLIDILKPPYTSLQCQTNYSLIPISSVDQNYCTTNNLCPSTECPSCPVGSGGVSSLYINDILHIWSPFIYMTIPQELSWDYEYTQWWTNMLIDIEWYNVDYEYMDWVVDIQNYKPNSEDLSTLVSSVLPLFVPWLVIILFIYFLFRFIKKIF